MSRLGIYVIYDKQGIIDRYAVYIAEELRKVTQRLAIVCIGEYKQEELNKLKHLSNDVFTRDNKGYDSGAFKDAICNYVGWDDVLSYDELVICNDTFYGPFWGFKPIFTEMEDKKADFWGMTLHNAIDDGEHHFPTHVQSYFLVFRQALLHADAFRKFWEELQYPTNYDEARDYYEMAISTIFPKLGFTYATYVNEIEDNSNRDIPYDGVNWRSYYMTNRLRCPILKKKRFTYDLQLSDDVSKELSYICDNSDYDVTMIWENVIRSYSIGALRQGCHLRCVLDDYRTESAPALMKRAQLIAVIDDKNDALMYLDRIGACSKELESLVIASNMQIKTYMEQAYPEVTTIVLPVREDIFQYLLFDLDENSIHAEYVLYITNRRKMDSKQPQFNEEMAQNNVWENLFLNGGYASNAIEYLEHHPEVGILVPNRDEDIMGDVRPLNWDIIQPYREALRTVLKISSDVEHYESEAFASYSFWIRGSLVHDLRSCFRDEKASFARNASHEMAMKLTLPLFMKSRGFLSIVMENARYAAMMRARVLPPRVETRVEERQVEKYLGLYKVNLNHFVKQCKFLYIYGAGKIADQVTALLNECQIPFDGYVVSDGQAHEADKNSHVVREFSETTSLEGVGYIVAVGEKLRPEVLDILERQGIQNIYVL